MSKKHYLCVDLNVKEKKETCYLAYEELRALYRFTASFNDPAQLLEALMKKQGNENMKKNIIKLNRDTFYLKETTEEDSKPFKVLYKKDEELLYIEPSELLKVIGDNFFLDEYRFYHQMSTRSQKIIFEYMLECLNEDMQKGIDEAYEISNFIGITYASKYGYDAIGEVFESYDWEQVASIPKNIDKLTRYICKDLHRKVILASLVKEELNESLITDKKRESKRIFWTSKFNKSGQSNKNIIDEANSQYIKYVDEDRKAIEKK